MVIVAEPINRDAVRFKDFMTRSARVARQRVIGKGADAPLNEEAQGHALNVLSYALKTPEAWPETRELLLALAPKMEQAGHRADWLPYLEIGLQLSQDYGDPWAEAEFRFAVGQLYRLMSRFVQARIWLKASTQIFETLGSHQGQARASNQLAYVAWHQHEYLEANQLAEYALTLLDEADPERAMSLSALGLVAMDKRQYQMAERYHDAALQIRMAQGTQRKIAWSLQNIGYALRGQGNYSEAINYYKRAISILEEVHDPANQAITQMNLGIAYYFCHLYNKALELYQLAESIFKQIDAKIYLAKIFLNRAICYLAMQDWAQAEDAFLVSIALFQELGDKAEDLNARDGLGLVYLGQGHYDKASVIFNSILDELPQIADTPKYEYLVRVLPEQVARARQK